MSFPDKVDDEERQNDLHAGEDLQEDVSSTMANIATCSCKHDLTTEPSQQTIDTQTADSSRAELSGD